MLCRIYRWHLQDSQNPMMTLFMSNFMPGLRNPHKLNLVVVAGQKAEAEDADEIGVKGHRKFRMTSTSYTRTMTPITLSNKVCARNASVCTMLVQLTGRRT